MSENQRRYLIPFDGYDYDTDPRTVLRRELVARRDRLLLPAVRMLDRVLRKVSS